MYSKLRINHAVLAGLMVKCIVIVDVGPSVLTSVGPKTAGC